MKPTERVLGWDLLRGLCAMAVAAYHLLMWQKVIAIHTFGSYGVYLFFVLSGASLAYTYADRIAAHQFSFRSFLWTRYLRLAPLYLALMLLVLPWKLLKDGATADLWMTYLLNALLLFGFYNPATHAVLVGGWSLGIEVIFYLLFPLLILSFQSRRIAWGVFGGMLAIQLVWIDATVGRASGYLPNAEAYHQAPAFAAYFVGGCLLGVAKRKGALKALPSESLGLAGLLAGFALMFLVNPAQQGDELVGWRGVLLCGLCFALVNLASRLDLKRTTASVAQHFGDATYGVYLLHPVIFFGLVFVVLPRLGVSAPDAWPIVAQLSLAAFVVLVSFGLALFSERYFEKPIRQRSKLRRRPATP